MRFFPSKRRLAVLPACFFLLLFSTPLARADDDPKAALKKAQAAQADAPTCRMTLTATDLDSQKVTVMTTEFVKPDSMHTRMEVNGNVRMEMLTDGKRTFMRQGVDTELQEAPAHVSNMLQSARRSLSLDTLMESAKDVKLIGHESVDGKPASVYGFTTELMGLATNTKVWVSDENSRPLKAEADSHGELKIGARAGQKANTHAVTAFDYDPAIKITLPGS